MKNEESEKQPSSAAELAKVIKEVGTKEIFLEYCQNLLDGIPTRMEGVTKQGYTTCPDSGHTLINIRSGYTVLYSMCF